MNGGSILSSLIIEVIEIADVIAHPDPETISLEICMVKGWSCVSRKGQFKQGDLAIYVPVGSALPQELIDELGIASYLKRGEAVKTARLRGFISQGLLLSTLPHHKLGDNVADEYGITKWQPPALQAEGAIPENMNMIKYTSIEHYKNFPNLFKEGERVRIREKIHGTNARYGNVPLVEDEYIYQYAVGGHELQYDTSLMDNIYVGPGERYDLKDKLPKDHVLCSEVYGAIQDLKYGLKNGKTDLVAFDLIVNRQYVNDEVMEAFCRENGIPVAPLLYDGPFSHEVVIRLANQKSVLCPDQISEGIVIKAAEEGYDLQVGRRILKFVGDAYYLRKGGTEFH